MGSRILICGLNGAGKSTLGRKLGEYNIGVIIQHITSGLPG